MPEAVERIHAAAGILREEHTPCDAVGKLTDRTTQVIKESQGMRLLQSLQCGGLQADITDFYAWVRAVAQYNPSAGWDLATQQIAIDALGDTEIHADARLVGDLGPARAVDVHTDLDPLEGGKGMVGQR